MLEKEYQDKKDIPEGYAHLYKDVDGVWTLMTGAEIKTSEDIKKLQGVATKVRGELDTLKGEIAPYTELGTVEEITEKLDSIPELEAKASGGEVDEEKIEGIVTARVATIRGPLDKEIKKLSGERDTAVAENKALKETEQTRRMQDDVKAAALEAGISDDRLEDIYLNAERMLEWVETEGEDGTGGFVTRTGVGVTPGIAAAVWLTEMQPKRPYWFEEPQGGGSGSNSGAGAGGENPWNPDTWNMTKQGQIHRENPDRAIQLAKSAGTTVGGLPAVKKAG